MFISASLNRPLAFLGGCFPGAAQPEGSTKGPPGGQLTTKHSRVAPVRGRTDRIALPPQLPKSLLSRAASASMRASAWPRLALSAMASNSEASGVERPRICPSTPASAGCGLGLEDLENRLSACGVVLADGAFFAPSADALTRWVSALRGACGLSGPSDSPATDAGSATASKTSPRQAIKLVWQDKASAAISPLPPPNSGAWQLDGPDAGVRSAVQRLPETRELLAAAQDYFNAVEACLTPQFDPQQFRVVKEIRYFDQVDEVIREATRWHYDGAPIVLTTLNTWLGAGTLYREPPKSLATSTKLLEARSCSNTLGQAPNNRVLAFHGSSGANPLWHSSPKTTQTRLLLIYRLLER